MAQPHKPQAGKELLLTVRLAFMGQGTSLHRWSIENDIDRSYVSKCISGVHTYPSAIAIRDRILKAAGIEVPQTTRKKRKVAA